MAESGTSDHCAMGKRNKEQSGGIQRTLHWWWKREVAYSVERKDDSVKHIFREHSLEAGHLANLGTEGKMKNTTDCAKNTEKWKAVRGYWDGSKNMDGVDVEM